MTPRPIIRWKSFWLGMLVLVFLGWAHWSSGGDFRVSGWDGRGFAVGVGRMDGASYVVTGKGSRGSGWMSGHVGYPTPERNVAAWRSAGYRVWRVSDAVAAMAVLGGLSGFLVWRWRRMDDLTKAHDAATAP